MVSCDDLDDEGAGVGSVVDAGGATVEIDGDVGRGASGGARVRVHVAGALPGESVSAVIAHVSPHRREAWASLRQITTASPSRRAPACRAFGVCGGCVLQHLDYGAQLRWKTARVRAVTAPHPDLAAVPIADCVASPRSLGYRNRSKLVCARSRFEGSPERLVLGAFAPRSHEVIDVVGGCRIAEPPLDDVAVALREVLTGCGAIPYDERTYTGDLRHAVLRVNHRGQVLVTLVTARHAWPAGLAVATALCAARPEVTGVVQNVNPARGNAIYGPDDIRLGGEATLEDAIGDVRLRLSPRAFLQANRDVAALAYQTIARAVALTGTEAVVDAYAGVGGIALTLAARARTVLGIEEHEGAVADANESALLNHAGNATFVAGGVAERLRAVDRAEVVILNPPRKGCATAVLQQVVRLAPRTIAYLSCDPDTLARDLAWLAPRGYRARQLTPFDMLPHTPHIEVLAVLEIQAEGPGRTGTSPRP